METKYFDVNYRQGQYVFINERLKIRFDEKVKKIITIMSKI